MMSKANELTSQSETNNVFVGQGLHTASTEAFFPESTYNADAFDDNGNVLYTNFPSFVDSNDNKVSSWSCSSELCEFQPIEQANEKLFNVFNTILKCDLLEASDYIQNIDNCTRLATHDPTLQGHSKECHLDENACYSTLLYLRRLGSHFPNRRQLVSMAYSVKKADAKVTEIGRALQLGDFSSLQNVTKQYRESKKTYRESKKTYSASCVVIDETAILEQFKNAFQVYHKRSLELA